MRRDPGEPKRQPPSGIYLSVHKPGPREATGGRLRGGAVSPRLTMPKDILAKADEYILAQEQKGLEHVFNSLDKKGDGKVRCTGRCELAATSN